MGSNGGDTRKILLLGAGFVSRPLTEYLFGIPNYQITIASNTPSRAYDLIRDNPRGLSIRVDLDLEPEILGRIMDENDIVISLLPPGYHARVAKECVAHKKPLVTTSYVSPEMRMLDLPAKQAGVILLNEIGLDPGIDHMSAMRIIDGVRNSGSKVTGFRSYCGGLPAPDSNNNPFGYKFSWSPRGVVLAARNAAKYLENGKLVQIPGPDLFRTCDLVNVEGFTEPFEAYPNRDSLQYQELYGLRSAETMYRGTLRYTGHCATWQKLADIGYFNIEPILDVQGYTYRQLTARLAGLPDTPDLEKKLIEKFGVPAAPEKPDIIGKWEWLGILNGKKPLPMDDGSPLDFLVAIFLEKLQYSSGERDMVVLHHIFDVETGGKQKRITSTLIDFGVANGDSAMSRTVGLPAAVATRLILEGRINLTGVQIPIVPEIYNPVLDELCEKGVKCIERAVPRESVSDRV